MPHHLVSEEGLKTFCLYCKTEVHPTCWTSEWDSEKHYKKCTCNSCGKDLTIRINFEGSGHDSWNGNKFKSKIVKTGNIEDRIKIIEAPQIVSRRFPKK